jgi:hypothetical protein
MHLLLPYKIEISMSCVGRKKRNTQKNLSTIKFNRSDGTEAPKALTNLILSYTNQSLEDFDDIDFVQKLFFFLSRST